MTRQATASSTTDEGARPAHAATVATVAAGLGVDPETGLSSAEVAARAATSGPNELDVRRREPVWSMVVEAATEPFVLLLAGAGILAIVLNEARDGILILLGLLPIVGADVVTEYRGERALEALRDASAPRARVRRDGAVREVPAADIVPGDVVLVRAGDVVPADLRVARAEHLVLDRSALTGESIPEPAGTDPDPVDGPLIDRRAIAYAGTSVVGGWGEGIVVATGARTEVGRIADRISGRLTRRSPLQRELDRLVRVLLVVAIGLIVIVTGLGFLRGQPLGANLLAGISAAIAAIPEEPPVLLAVILGLGAYRLLRRNVLVRRLNAEEVLGAVDLIITDKTGTLTRNRLEVATIRGIDGPIDAPEAKAAILAAGIRAESDYWVRPEGAAPGAFTRAMLAAHESLGPSPGVPDLAAGTLIEAIPASSARPFSTTSIAGDSGQEHLAIGAPEAVARLAAHARGGAGASPGWERAVEAGAVAGERLVAVARGRRATGPDADWEIIGLIGFADPLRDGIQDALRDASTAGIQTIVVTGDHPATAAAVARAAGLGGDHIVTGGELDGWDDEHLAGQLGDLHIVARSTPEHKERLVRVARERGRLVAVTGDGVNDAPALHHADVAVAMGSGTAVAKEAADLVLGDDSFATLLYGLGEGRRIVDNVQKGLVFLISTHTAFLGFILIATLAGFGQPLLPIQILWMELFIDSSTSIAFEREAPEPDLLRRPPRRVGAPLLSSGLLARIALAGSFSAAATLVLMLNDGGTADHARWLAYTALVCGQVVRAYANRSLRTPIHRIGPNRVLLGGAVAVVLVQAAIPFVPILAEAFRATPLDGPDWILVAVVALLPALFAEVVRTRSRLTWVA